MPVEGNEGMTYASRNLFATASRCVISWSRTWPVIELGQRLGVFLYRDLIRVELHTSGWEQGVVLLITPFFQRVRVVCFW